MVRTWRRGGPWAIAVVLGLGLAACSGDSPEDPAPPESEAPGGTESPGETEAEADDDDQVEPRRDPVVSLEDEVGALDDLSDFECGPDDSGVWSASGALTNPTDEDVVYVVNVGVVETAGRSSLVRHNIVLDLAENDSVTFQTAEEELLTSDREDIECVVRVNRGAEVAD